MYRILQRNCQTHQLYAPALAISVDPITLFSSTCHRSILQPRPGMHILLSCFQSPRRTATPRACKGLILRPAFLHGQASHLDPKPRIRTYPMAFPPEVEAPRFPFQPPAHSLGPCTGTAQTDCVRVPANPLLL